MSVIIKDGGVFKLYCKGADSSILGRLAKNKTQPVLKNIEERINEFSKLGLRTLCMAFRILTEKEVQNIRSKLIEMSVLLENREQALGRNYLSEQFQSTVERDLVLLGCSAVEDKLQDRVPEVIHNLLQGSRQIGY